MCGVGGCFPPATTLPACRTSPYAGPFAPPSSASGASTDLGRMKRPSRLLPSGPRSPTSPTLTGLLTRTCLTTARVRRSTRRSSSNSLEATQASGKLRSVLPRLPYPGLGRSS